MFGRTESLTAAASLAIPIASGIVLATDLARGKIYNWLTFPMLALGLGSQLLFSGWAGLCAGLAGVLVAFAVYGWMFWLGILGAGDVKFLMALGAWAGARYALDTAVLALLLGGVLSLLAMIVSGRIADFARRMLHFLLTLLVKELEAELPKLDRGFTLPYGVPLAIAAVWTWFAPPLERWGVSLWPG